MKTFHIHIQGIVQGVGFRPLVFSLAANEGLHGYVNNTSDGVHIRFHAENLVQARTFEQLILNQLPPRARVTHSRLTEVFGDELFEDFRIIHSQTGENFKGLMLTPDFALCKKCREELYDQDNRRYLYPFITCTDCGPRYSLIRELPYDRERSTMNVFTMCDDCQREYEDPFDRRYHSQTNSCPQCAIELFLWTPKGGKKKLSRFEEIAELWKSSKIVAIKGIGGYLLTCDATQPEVVQRLRKRKNRPDKPFALMYHNVYELAEDVEMDIGEKLELESVEAPIVIMSLKEDPWTPLALDAIAPGLQQLGVMLPYTPLYDLLLGYFKKPIVATSGNPSNSTIVYSDEQAIEQLSLIADAILINNREIVLPQDDSVVRFTPVKRQRIVLRHSRGMAPSLIQEGLRLSPNAVLAMGAMLKSTFSILHQGNLFVSQYLGSTEHYEAQENYRGVLRHFERLFHFELEYILVDKHPAYFSTRWGRELAEQRGVPVLEVQHHLAHFYAVLGEHNLLEAEERVLGVIWDGTGLGDDGQIWGGEFFACENGRVERLGHLPYFNFILGDKMPREPRISALALTHGLEGADEFLQSRFTAEEWRIYRHLLETGSDLKTSSVGRLFDGVASLLFGIDRQTYEGQAAMQLEQAAYRYFRKNGISFYYSYLPAGILPEDMTIFLLQAVLQDLKKGLQPDFISARFHLSLVQYIANFAETHGFEKIAFSGGVFQNAWLADLAISLMGDEKKLYFHRQLSPNDECISFGQVMAFQGQGI